MHSTRIACLSAVQRAEAWRESGCYGSGISRLGNNEVAVNDRVRLYKNECQQLDRRAVCKKVTVAEGTVTQLLDEHYSVVTFPAGTPFEEGYTVEKL